MVETGGSDVLFIVLDTVRKDRLSVYDERRETTPNLADFAEEAAVFANAVAPAPWTLPVHASMFTGRYPSEHQATQETPYLEGHATLAESLSTAGYDTACYSSNAWITSYTNLTRGFDDHDNFFQAMPSELLSGPLATLWKTMNDNDRLRSIADRLVQLGNVVHERFAAGGGGDTKTPQVIDKTIEFIDSSDDFFAFINLMDAHLPYHPPEEYADRFAPGVDSNVVCQNSKEYNCGARDIDDDEWTDIKGLYDAELAHIDDQLDRLFAHLKATDQWEETTVIVCADHGELFGEHGLYGHEFGIYDPLVNVPLMVKHPEIDSGRDEETTVELIDLYHTILDTAGATGLGESLDPARSLLSDEYREFGETIGEIPRGDVGFVEYHQPVVELRQLETKAKRAGIELDEQSRFYSRMGAARTTDDKYIHCTRIPDEAYHIGTDPGETENLVGTDRESDGLNTALWEFIERVGAEWPDERDGDGSGVDEMDEEAKDRLQDLGYIE
jgi:arylsulfatase A-like enzyme